jgi:methyl-accepting chemotaxis protein
MQILPSSLLTIASPLVFSVSLASFTLTTSTVAYSEIPAALVSHEERFSSDAHAALGVYRGMVEEHIEGIIRTLRVLADTDEARSASWGAIQPLLARYSNDLTTDATAWFATPDGNYSTTEASDVALHSIKDRPYFPALMSGKEVFGDLVVSQATGHRSVIIAEPVFAAKGDKRVVGALGVSLRVRLLSELVDKHMLLPEQEYFYALERDTKIALHRKVERMFKTPSDVGDEALGEQFKRELRHDKGSFEYTLDGKKIAAIYELSPQLGWYFFMAKEIS